MNLPFLIASSLQFRCHFIELAIHTTTPTSTHTAAFRENLFPAHLHVVRRLQPFPAVVVWVFVLSAGHAECDTHFDHEQVSILDTLITTTSFSSKQQTFDHYAFTCSQAAVPGVVWRRLPRSADVFDDDPLPALRQPL